MARRPVHSDPHPPESGGSGAGAGGGVDRRHQAAVVGVAVAAILLAWFALANLRRVQIDFWVFNRQAPLILVIVISGLLGALITALIMRRKPKA
ncbi:MAG: lipopolysaccharide assembly protein LapA domain-containing protein [Acidimicrobiales bacterium]